MAPPAPPTEQALQSCTAINHCSQTCSQEAEIQISFARIWSFWKLFCCCILCHVYFVPPAYSVSNVSLILFLSSAIPTFTCSLFPSDHLFQFNIKPPVSCNHQTTCFLLTLNNVFQFCHQTTCTSFPFFHQNTCLLLTSNHIFPFYHQTSCFLLLSNHFFPVTIKPPVSCWLSNFNTSFFVSFWAASYILFHWWNSIKLLFSLYLVFSKYFIPLVNSQSELVLSKLDKSVSNHLPVLINMCIFHVLIVWCHLKSC